MNLALLQSIFTVLSDIASFLIKYGPDLITDVDNIVADLKLAWASATSGTAITPDQQTQIDNALDSANTALQTAVAAATAADNVGNVTT